MNEQRQNQYLVLPENGNRKDTKLAVEYSEAQIADYLKQGYVIVNQADFNKLIGNGDGEYLIADDGSVYPKPAPPMQSCWKPLSLPKSQSLKLRGMQERLSLLPTTATAMITMTRQGSALMQLSLLLMCRALMHPLTGQPLIIKMLRLHLLIYVA